MLPAFIVWVVGSLSTVAVVSLVLRTNLLERRRADQHLDDTREDALRASNPEMYQSMIDLRNRFDRTRDAT